MASALLNSVILNSVILMIVPLRAETFLETFLNVNKRLQTFLETFLNVNKRFQIFFKYQHLKVQYAFICPIRPHKTH